MPRIENSCPFDARARAERCESCCESAELPPCTLAWLRAHVTPSNVVGLVERRVRAKAA